MAIKGLTDNAAALPQIMTIRKGGPKTDPKKPGPDLQYFRADSVDVDAMAAFKAHYGDQPKAISVLLPFERLEENFEAWQEEYVASGLKHRCDGETCVLWLKKDGSYSTDPVPCPGGCKAAARLKVIIPELGRMAIAVVLTTSKHDIINIHRNLLALQQGVGRLSGIRLWLRRVPVKITTPSAEGRARREKWLIQIEPAKEWVAAYLATSEQRALNSAQGVLPTSQQLALNPAPMEVDEEDDEDGDVLEAEPVEENASVSREDAIELLHKIWPKTGKTEAEWEEFKAKNLAKKSVNDMLALADTWAEKLAAKAA